MANVSILWNKTTDLGTYSGGSWLAGLPLGNLQAADVKRVARSTNATLAFTKFCVDVGAARPYGFSTFVLGPHNFSIGAKVRFVVTNDASDAGTRIYDSGLVNAWEPTIPFGSQAWGTFDWSGVNVLDYPQGPIVIHIAPSTYFGRYVWVYIEDASNSVGYLEAGRFMAGVCWQPLTNVDYGAKLRVVDPSDARRTRGGRRVVVPRPKYRTMEMVFGSLTESEAMGVAYEITSQIGKSGDLFICMDIEDDGSTRFRRSMFASLVDTAAIDTPYFDNWSWQLLLEELV